MESLRQFMQGVKNGAIRGDFIQKQIAENIVVELSVGPFQYGYIHLRVMVDDERISPEKDMFYRRLYAIDTAYEDHHDTIASVVESENETPVRNAHEWEAEKPEKATNAPFLPDEFNPDSTVFFSDYVQLRDDVTVVEALETNRAD